MIALLILVSLTIAHLILFCSSWPGGALDISELLPQSPPKVAVNLTIGLTLGLALSQFIKLIKSTRLVAAGFTAAVILVAGVAYIFSPLSRSITPVPLLIAIGVALAIAFANFLAPQTRDSSLPTKQTLSPLCFILLALNLLLIIGHSSSLAPTGFLPKKSWSYDNLAIRHADSVAISPNLLFYSVRSAISTIIGNSIMLNSVVSMTLCAIGLGLFSFSLQRLGGAVLGLLALVLIATERWVMVTAYAANLPSSLIACSGLLFYILVKVLLDYPSNDAKSARKIAVLVFIATLLSMYSYAAVRIPYAFSMLLIASVLLIKTQGSSVRRSVQTLLAVALPATLALCSILVIAYHGRISHMRREIFVGWPPESIRPNPGPAGIKDFVLMHNPDLPVWKQIARPADGSNLSLIWTRTPRETLAALWTHLKAIVQNLPEFFPLQPLISALAVIAIFRAPLLPSTVRTAVLLALLWSCIWIASFLLVADAVAYRRGVAFSASIALLASLSFYGASIRSRGGLTILLCGLLITAAKFPYELHFANQGEARARMFTVCNSALPIRTLLKSPQINIPDSNPTYLLASTSESVRELSCKTALVNSTEWKRVRPSSESLFLDGGAIHSELEKLPAGANIVTFCSSETRRVGEIEQLCASTTQTATETTRIDIPNALEPLYWIVLKKQAQSS